MSTPITLAAGIQLGSTANLIYGYRPDWENSNPNSSPLFQPAQKLIGEQAATVDSTSSGWGDPVITLCESAEALITALFNYNVVAASDENPAPAFPAGPLVLRDGDRAQVQQKLKAKLGVDVSDPSLSFALVRIVRDNGAGTHASFQAGVFVGKREPEAFVADQHRSALSKLRHGPIVSSQFMTGRLATGRTAIADPKPDDAKSYLTFFENYGTHYVSKIYAGDVIYQVFAYKAAAFQRIQSDYAGKSDQLSGPTATSFEYYTSPVNNAGFGFVAQYGNILSLSGDPALAASVASGAWVDHEYANTASVFEAFRPGFGVKLDTAFTKVVATGFELTSLSAFAEKFRASTWRLVFKAAMYQKFGSMVQPQFSTSPTYDYASIFPENDTGYLSTIATPSIDAFKTRLDLSKVQMVAADTVQNFTAVSNVVQMSTLGPAALPGANVTLVSHVFDIESVGGLPPVLTLSDAAYASYQIACQDFNGALYVSNSAGSEGHIIVDGIRYLTVPSTTATGRNTVTVAGDVRQPASDAVLQQIVPDLNFSLAAAEALLYSRTANAKAARELITKYLNWLANSISATTTNPDLPEIKVRAFYLARVTAKLALDGMPVPYLKYETYQPLVDAILGVVREANDSIRDYQSQIALRKQAELTIDVAKTLNQNIIASGQLLEQFIGATAANQGDLANSYNQIIANKQKSLEAEQAKLTGLLKLLSDQQQAVKIEVEKYKDAVTDWENVQILSFSLDLASNLFTLGFSFAIPSSSLSAVKDLGETAQMIQKALNVFNALNTMYKTLLQGVTNIKAAQSALTGAGYDGVQFPSALQWQEMGINMQAILNSGPAIPAKNDLSAAFSILVLRGQAVLTSQANIQQISGDIYLNAKQAQITQNQQKRLAALAGYLQPANVDDLDTSKIDLVGLTGAMQLLQNQMLGMLARTLALQDEALQYEYLQTPAPITSFDLIALRQVMVAQQQSIIAGLSVQPGPQQLPQPLTYTVPGIPAAAMTGGNTFAFTIPLSAREFFKYAMVRVSKVIASVSGVKCTTGGDYLLKVVFDGDPFGDRDSNRNVLTFNTISREFDYLYDAATGSAKFGTGTGTWEDQVSQITPFSQWEVSFPASSSNQGIEFVGSMVTVTLSFTISALLRDPASFTREVSGRPPARAVAVSAGAGGAGAVMAVANPPGVNDVLTEMNKVGTVLNGWDAVFNLTEEQVNANFLAQWQKRESDPSFFWVIPEQVSRVTNPQTKVTTVTTWNMTLSAPRIQFIQNNPGNVELFMDIISGNYAYGVEINGQYTPIVPKTPIDPKRNPPPSIKGNVPLAKVQGQVQTQHDVVLDLGAGSFSGLNLDVDSGNPTFNDTISTYVQNTKAVFKIGTLDYKNVTLLAALTPTQFRLNTTTTNSGLNLLQIFITTNGTPSSSLGININEPVPEGYQCSLLINTQVLFNQIFVQSYQGGAFGMQAINPGGGSASTNPWSAQIAYGSITGQVQPDGDFRISDSSNAVTIDLTGMKFTVTPTTGLQASFQRQFTQSFQYYYCPPPPPCGISQCYWASASLPVTISINFPMPLVVSGAGQNQSVQIQTSPASPVIDGTLDSSGPCTCNNRNVQEQFLSQLRQQLPAPLVAGVNVQFKSVSLFALENLLFPGQSFIQLQAAYAPGDMAVFGSLANS